MCAAADGDAVGSGHRRGGLPRRRGDELSFIDNDDYVFNVSLTIGERVTGSLLRGAGELLGRDVRSAHGPCALFGDDLARPAAADAVT